MKNSLNCHNCSDLKCWSASSIFSCEFANYSKEKKMKLNLHVCTLKAQRHKGVLSTLASILCFVIFIFKVDSVRTVPSGHAFYPWTLNLFHVVFCWWATGEPSWLIQSSTKRLGTWWVQDLHYNHCICVLVPTHKCGLVKAGETNV